MMLLFEESGQKEQWGNLHRSYWELTYDDAVARSTRLTLSFRR